MSVNSKQRRRRAGAGDHLRGLNPAQQEAVLAIEGPLLVLAGAGTGKTRVVTCRIAEILTRGVPASAVCAVTFTNKAAREMKGRVRELIGGASVDEMVLSTFHSLGLRILREHGEVLGLPPRPGIADESDQVALITDALREVGVSRTVLAPREAHQRISRWKNAGLDPEQALASSREPLDESLAVVYQRYEEELARRSLLDFDDLILKPLALLAKHPDVRRRLQDRWHFLLVDEYQDTNACQYHLLRHLAGARRNLCVVGDDDQSIYSWRGAEPDRILTFTRDFAGAKVVTLEQNYRSLSAILDAANQLIAQNTQRRPKRLWSGLGDGELPELYAAEDEKDELDCVVSRILQLRSREGLRFEDFAVLFRANSQCRPLEQALRARKIPYRVIGTMSFFDRREVRDLLAYLKLAANPKDDLSFLRIVNTPPRGIGRGTIDRLHELAATDRTPLLETLRRRLAELPPAARQGAEALAGTVEALREVAGAQGVAAALRGLIDGIGYREHLRTTTEDALELAARLSVVDDLIVAAESHASGASDRTLEGFLDALLLRDAASDDDEDGSPAVTLLTLHAAKGMEFPIVFLVGVEEGVLPHRNSVGSGDETESVTSLRALEEERRLLYVGITRARRRLFLSYVCERRRHGREVTTLPSRFLDEIGSRFLHATSAADEAPATEDSGKAWLAAIRERLRSEGDAPFGI